MVRLVSPILLAALGGLLTERAGIFNVALEGLMLTGAFAAVVATSRTGDPAHRRRSPRSWRRWSCRSSSAIVVVDLRGDAIVAGLAINLLALGATTFLMRAIFGVQGGFYDPTMPGLAPIDMPFLAGIPVRRCHRQRPDRPRLGRASRSWSRAPGAPVPPPLRHPAAGGGRGPGRRGQRGRPGPAGPVRAPCSASGALCGLAGAQLSLGIVTQFVEGMTFGRGFIALVAVMFGRAHPIGVLGASLFFGGAYALALRLQGQGVPPQFVNMLPYLATIVALVAVYGRAAARRRARQAHRRRPARDRGGRRDAAHCAPSTRDHAKGARAMTRRVVLDMDVGIDDAIAILYLAARTDVEVVALGSVHGNGYTDVTTRNALIVLELAGLGHVPVARGADEPLVVPLSVATFVHGEDGLGDVGLPGPGRARPPASMPRTRSSGSAWSRPGELDLFAVGPLTNLGLALRATPRRSARYRSVVIMGGAGLEVRRHADHHGRQHRP